MGCPILEDVADRQHAPQHLQEWQALVQANNPGKNTMGRYARLFELHHFWRALHQRHAEALHRCRSKLENMFASFLHTSPDFIHKDLGSLADTLGEAWTSRD